MALEKDMPLPIVGGFIADKAYITIGKVTDHRLRKRIGYTVQFFRDRAARDAHGRAEDDLAAAEERNAAARAALHAARSMAFGTAETRDEKAKTFQEADLEHKASIAALEAAHQALADPALKPFLEQDLFVPLAQVASDDDPKRVDIAKLYAHAKASYDVLADAVDLL